MLNLFLDESKLKMKYLSILNIILIFIILTVIITYIIRNKQNHEEYEEVFMDIMELFEEQPQPPKSKVAIACLMRKPIDLPMWFKHHKQLGVSHFFIRLEDSPGWDEYLSLRDDVTFEIGSSDKNGNNYETLIYRQVNFVNNAIKSSHKMGIQWIFHIDADELLHGSLQFLDSLDSIYKCIRLENAEAVFRENEESCFSAVKFLKCSKKAPCRSYINGKGGARIEEGVSIAGPHHFAYKNEIEGPNIYETPFKQLHVLHFDSCSFGAWAEKFKHLSNNKKNNMPFPYYYESMQAASNAYDVYKKHNMKNIEDIDAEQIYSLDEKWFDEENFAYLPNALYM